MFDVSGYATRDPSIHACFHEMLSKTTAIHQYTPIRCHNSHATHGGPRWDDILDAVVAICQRRWNHQGGLGALTEADDPEIPPVDNVPPAYLEVEGHPPVPGRIDLLAGRPGRGGPVDGSHVVHLDVVPRQNPIGLGAVGRAVVNVDVQRGFFRIGGGGSSCCGAAVVDIAAHHRCCHEDGGEQKPERNLHRCLRKLHSRMTEHRDVTKGVTSAVVVPPLFCVAVPKDIR